MEIAVRRMLQAGITPRAHMNAVYFGVDPDEYETEFAALAPEEQASTIDAWNRVMTPYETAVAIVLQHPELSSVEPGVMEIVKQTSLNPRQNQDMQDFVGYLEDLPNSITGTPSWYNKSWSKWASNPGETDPSKINWVNAEANTELKSRTGEKLSWPQLPDRSGAGIPLYNLTDEFDPPQTKKPCEGIVEASGPTVRGALVNAKNNPALAGQLWNVQQGVTNISTGSTASASKPTVSDDAIEARAESQFIVEAVAPDSGPSGFSAKNKTTMYGLKTYPLKWDNSTKTLTVPVKNCPNRYLGVYVEFFKEDGTALTQSELSTKVGDDTEATPWDNRVPSGNDAEPFFNSMIQSSKTKNYLTWLSPGAAVAGASVPALTQITNVEFLWPDKASKAQLLFGGLGFLHGLKDWNASVNLAGTMGTCVLGVGLSSLKTAFGVNVVSPFVKELQGKWGFGFYAVAGYIGIGALITGIAESKNAVGKKILSSMASIACSAVFGALDAKVRKTAYTRRYGAAAAEMAGEMTAEEVLEEVPVIGWALRIASTTIDVVSLVETTTELFDSPATFDIEIQRSMNLTVQVSPDPAHGKQGFDPVWPVVGDHWMCQVKYPGVYGSQGGTTYTMVGPLDGGKAGDQIVEFKDIPSGGIIDVVFRVYSDSNWLAGQWESGWVKAIPDANDAMSVSGAIKENLVPLTSTTTYSQKRALKYEKGDTHFWIDISFSVAASLTPDFDKGGVPDQAIQKAFEENGNTLTSDAWIYPQTKGTNWTLVDYVTGANFTVEQHMIFSGKVFAMKAAPYSNTLDHGGTPNDALQTVFKDNNYILPTGGNITVVTKGVKWTIAPPGQPPVYVLTANGSNIDVTQTLYELRVANTNEHGEQRVPPLPESYPVSAPSGNNTGQLLNIIHNNREFQLGYSYLASGQNMPFSGTSDVSEDAMYATQSISTLSSPQEQIYTPTVGYTAPSFVAFDQFGLTPLFNLPDTYQSDLSGGPVPKELADEFAAFGLTLPADAVISTTKDGKDWTIGEPGLPPLYEIRVTQTQQDSKMINQLSIYDYPVPGQSNFIFEPQSAPKGKLGKSSQYHLKGVDLRKPPGEYTFDSASTNIWGIFSHGSGSGESNSFQEAAVHPNGFAIALDNKNAKLFVLKLPANAMEPEKAPLALPLSGLGGRQGLLDGPQAMNVTVDGRILVLETGNIFINHPRIQAFDTMGNPVPSFSSGEPLIIENAAGYATDFDDRIVSQDLMNQFQENFDESLAPKVTVNPSSGAQTVMSDLDNGKVDQTLIDKMSEAGLAKTGAPVEQDNTKSGDFTVSVTKAGALWYVMNTKSKAVYDVRAATDQYGDLTGAMDLYQAFELTITLQSPGTKWRIEDHVNAETYDALYDKAAQKMRLQKLSSTMKLRDQSPTGTLRYLDLATETKGYIYVLSVIDNNYNASKDPNDLTFQLDVYSPDGKVLLDKPQTGINAGKITVDQYRTLYTLNFDSFSGPDGRTEPGVSQWAPSTPQEATPGIGG
ncbi:hypothetical protein [Nisaea sp.]|uniref:hypothetical protein n=1 Tax=Nisaea sp. TaxID=2024842 RepID=UPI0032987969